MLRLCINSIYIIGRTRFRATHWRPVCAQGGHVAHRGPRTGPLELRAVYRESSAVSFWQECRCTKQGSRARQDRAQGEGRRKKSVVRYAFFMASGLPLRELSGAGRLARRRGFASRVLRPRLPRKVAPAPARFPVQYLHERRELHESRRLPEPYTAAPSALQCERENPPRNGRNAHWLIFRREKRLPPRCLDEFPLPNCTGSFCASLSCFFRLSLLLSP